MQNQLQEAQQSYAQITEQSTVAQRTLETERAAWFADKKTLEDTIADLSTSERTSQSDKEMYETQIRQQEARAKVCTQSDKLRM